MKCPMCGGAVSMREWLPPYHVEVSQHGSKPYDLVWGAGGGYGFLVSDRFREVYEDANLTGLHGFHPVKIDKVDGKFSKAVQLPRYFYVAVVYDGSRFDLRRSNITWPQRPQCPWCEYCGYGGVDAVNGLYLLEGTLTGSDIFRAYGLNREIATQRFVKACSDAGLNMKVPVPINEYQFSYRPSLE